MVIINSQDTCKSLHIYPTLLYGQKDYVCRGKVYLSKILPDVEIKSIIFSDFSEDIGAIRYDFASRDLDLLKFPRDVYIGIFIASKFLLPAKEHLEKLGYKNLLLYNSHLDNLWKRMYFSRTCDVTGKKFDFIDSHLEKFSISTVEREIKVYMAKSHVDKPLNNYPHTLSTHIIPIQVGAALTDKRVAAVTDDTGDNISDRNRHFSETTALYWMWKNAEADYLGLCHYRRLWKDLDFIADKLQNDMIDVVLPVPTLCVHSVYEDYMERYIPTVYPTMLDVLREMSPDYYEASKEIYRGHVFYACNMLIAKRRVLHELCNWMFPMVFEIENRIGDLSDPYLNRYAGFCTERLITLYFLYNKEHWRITHADKIFIE